MDSDLTRMLSKNKGLVKDLVAFSGEAAGCNKVNTPNVLYPFKHVE